MKIKFNIKSTDHLSCLLFGGTLYYDDYEPIIIDGDFDRVKSGQNAGKIKTKKVKKSIKIKGFNLNPLPEWKTKKEGFYQTNNKVLETIGGLKLDEEMEEEYD